MSRCSALGCAGLARRHTPERPVVARYLIVVHVVGGHTDEQGADERQCHLGPLRVDRYEHHSKHTEASERDLPGQTIVCPIHRAIGE